MHGYDIVDPNVISEELGGRAGFEEVIKEAQTYGLGWLQDIVPNHASYSSQNKRVNAVLAQGAGSPYACFFDIDWNYPSPKLQGKLFAPFLSECYRESLKNGKISLIHNGGFKVKYDELEFPVSAPTQQHLELSGSIQQALDKYNSNQKLLDALLTNQHYRLGYWRATFKHINYRRFFDIIDLIGVRMENSAAFEEMHRLIFELTASGMFSGLRVDHIDGLYEPRAYLHILKERCPEAYLLVEKILTGDEQPPPTWAVKGTTGYDFLDCVNKLFIQTENESTLDVFYREFTDNKQDFTSILYEAKEEVIKTYFWGDVRNLARLFSETLSELGYSGRWKRVNLMPAVAELMACFPVYRAYLEEQSGEEVAFRAALGLVKQRNPAFADEFSAISYLLKQTPVSPDALHAIKRFQQFTGAVMAKGFEDTALYRYTRLLSLNEVGSSPAQFGLSAQQFHEFNILRQKNYPLTLNATSTHDTKRGEDVRARLNVLSEIPAEFGANVEQWAKINIAKKGQVNGKPAPDRNEEYYLYQILLGAYPWDPIEKQGFTERIKQHMIKALREAKVHTGWVSPNLSYEEAAAEFAAEILADAGFMDAFLPFQQRVACFGFYNSLAQTLLKITCPGIPDFYQGTELWDLNLVDPDNRRSVNFQKRQELLSEIVHLKPQKAPELLSDYGDAKAKLYIIYKSLGFRGKQRRLFEEGGYLPLAAKGTCADNVVAFLRKKDATNALIVVPRFLTNLFYIRAGGSAQRGLAPETMWSIDWADTYICLPEGTPTRWSDAFTDRTTLSCCGRLALRDVLGSFPVALFWGDSRG